MADESQDAPKEETQTARDEAGQPLKVGDWVTLKAEVTQIVSSEQVSLNPIVPAGDRAAFNINSRALRKTAAPQG